MPEEETARDLSHIAPAMTVVPDAESSAIIHDLSNFVSSRSSHIVQSIASASSAQPSPSAPTTTTPAPPPPPPPPPLPPGSRKVDPYLTEPDLAVLGNLLHDADLQPADLKAIDPVKNHDDGSTLSTLAKLQADPVVFCTWDYQQLPLSHAVFGPVLKAYIVWAQTVVRNPNDVVFLTHILLYTFTSLPSAIFLYYRFSWLHGVAHMLLTGYYVGSFTLMLHNCIHQNGLLARRYALADTAWPYVLGPLMGQTWHSYYYHHVKHHHVEGNGPDDLSSTVRYQRDDVLHFLCYVGRFLTMVWLELPLYFFRKRKPVLGCKAAFWEWSSYLFMYVMARLHFNAALCTLIVPFCALRVGLMVGNFGQHALVDDVDPKSDFRSSITLIDVPSNRFCFNDGYHTSHHLNPRRHWQDHQLAFMKGKREYQEGKALVFHNIDYLMMTFRLLRKDYLYLADCMIPIGDQVKLTREERAALLRQKTRRFTEEEIQEKFYRKKV